MIVKGQHPIHFLLRDQIFLSVKIDSFGSPVLQQCGRWGRVHSEDPRVD